MSPDRKSPNPMSFFEVIILGIVEGITEFLPISSTGHLILTAKLLGFSQDKFTKSFEIAIQLGAILSVVVLYAKSLIRDLELFKKVLVACLPTMIVGLVFYKLIKKFLFNSLEVVLISLLPY